MSQKFNMNKKALLGILLLSFMVSIFFERNFPPEFTLKNQNSTHIQYGPKTSQDVYPYNSSELSNITLELVLHDTDHFVEGIMNIDYFNNESIPLNGLYFHTFVDGMDYDTRPGSISIFHVYEIIESSSVPMTFALYPEFQYMWVDFFTPLIPKSRIEIEIYFNTTFPDGGIDRCNEHEYPGDPTSRIFKYAWGYPIPVVYDEFDGWNLDSYNIDGEPFYADMAWYNVSVTVRDDFVVAATGLNYFTEDLGDWKKYYYDPELPVREFTFSASKYFIIQTKYFNGKAISNYYIPRSASFWGEYMINQTMDAFGAYRWLIGEYPYPSLNVVEEYTHYGGMEHACQVYVTAYAENYVSPRDITEIIMSHELAHQWFFHLIGNDQADAGFIDEGFACWLDAFYQETQHPDWNSDFASAFKSVRMYEFNTGQEHRINASIYDFPYYNSDYWYVSYTKCPIIFQKLRILIGNTAFYDGLRLMYQRFRFSFIWLEDVQQAFEDTYGQDLDWFFQPWFNNGKLPRYIIADAIYNPIKQEIGVDIRNTRREIQLYDYSQLVPLKIFDQNSVIIYSNNIWVNDTNSLDVVIELPDGTEPYKVVIYNRGTALAYHEDDENDTIDEFVVSRKTIPAFSFAFLFLSCVSALLFLSNRLKLKINK